MTSTAAFTKVKYAGFSALAVLLVLGSIEGASAVVWSMPTRRAVRASNAVDISRSSQPQPGIGFRLPSDTCTEYRYGLHDTASYNSGTPGWELCTNSLGWRGPEFSIAKLPNTFRIVCMGDSHTMGQGVALEETYCRLFGRLLEHDLREAGLAVEVIDAGVWGHSSYQGLISYKTYVKDWQADLLTVSYGSNDRAPLAKEGTRFRDRLLYALPGEESELSLVAYSDVRWNTVKMFQFAARTMQEWKYARQRDADDFEGEYSYLQRRSTPLEYGENIERLLAWIQADSAMVVVIGIGIFEETYRRILARSAEAGDVVFIPTWENFAAAEPQIVAGEEYGAEKEAIDGWLTDAGRAITGIFSRYLTIDGAHPSKIGHRIIAEQLYETSHSDVVSRLSAMEKEGLN
jgi:lysophospholipase L1-like esterase